MIAIIDYDAGNLKSVEKALIRVGATPVVTRDKEIIRKADKVILPGVGAFGDAMEKLHSFDLVDTIHEVIDSGKPFLGICLGLQLLFEYSEEKEGCKGLSVLKGGVKRIPDAPGLKVPHMGWNSLKVKEGAKLFSNLPEEPYVYFVHSFKAVLEDRKNLLAHTFYGEEIPAVIGNGKNVFGCQFHPEKSEKVGLSMLKAFCNYAKNR